MNWPVVLLGRAVRRKHFPYQLLLLVVVVWECLIETELWLVLLRTWANTYIFFTKTIVEVSQKLLFGGIFCSDLPQLPFPVPDTYQGFPFAQQQKRSNMGLPDDGGGEQYYQHVNSLLLLFFQTKQNFDAQSHENWKGRERRRRRERESKQISTTIIFFRTHILLSLSHTHTYTQETRAKKKRGLKLHEIHTRNKNTRLILPYVALLHTKFSLTLLLRKKIKSDIIWNRAPNLFSRRRRWSKEKKRRRREKKGYETNAQGKKHEEEKWGNCSARESEKRNKFGNADNGDGDPNACLFGGASESRMFFQRFNIELSRCSLWASNAQKIL